MLLQLTAELAVTFIYADKNFMVFIKQQFISEHISPNEIDLNSLFFAKIVIMEVNLFYFTEGRLAEK